MNHSEIMRKLGTTIYDRAMKYFSKGAVKDFKRQPGADGICYITATVQGGQNYRVRVWLRKDGSFVSASCSCPYNENGDGLLCKHIGAVLLHDARYGERGEEMSGPSTPAKPAVKPRQDPASIAGVMRGSDYAAKRAAVTHSDNYNASLEMLFGRKWREDAIESDSQARALLRRYENVVPLAGASGALPGSEGTAAGTLQLEPELLLNSIAGRCTPQLRVKISDGGRPYLIKDIQGLVDEVDQNRTVRYGKQLLVQHRPDSLDERSRALLELLRRQLSILQYAQRMSPYDVSKMGLKAGALPLAGEVFDALFALYYAEGILSGHFLKKSSPELILRTEKAKGGVRIALEPEISWFEGAAHVYLFSEDNIWQIARADFVRLSPALEMLGGKNLFFTQKDVGAFCSYVLPELGDKLQIDDPDRLLLDQIPLTPVVQFYLDVPREMTLSAHAEFLYGEDKVTPFDPVDSSLLRDVRAERRAARLLEEYMRPTVQNAGVYETGSEEAVYRFLEQGVPALMTEGEVYLSEAFRDLQVPAPKVTVGVSVHGSVLDLDVDTGEFPAEELKGLLQSLRRKKRYHRLRDGRLLRLDESLHVLDELDETLELSGAKLGQTHVELPLYRAPSLESALAGQSGVRFNRDDAFRRISRSFHSVQDSEYVLPASLQGVLRKYQRDGYRWLRTLDSYGMGGILADDMGLGKTLQVLAYLLALKEGGQALPSLIVCPASLVLNWEEECAKFTPQLRCLAVDGSAARRAELAAQFGNYDLVVTSYDLLRRDAELYEKQDFYACIIDEAQAIKNHTTQKYRAVCQVRSRVRFALTGTPVENRLSELWSIFSFLMPGYLYPYHTFCGRFEKPIVQERDEEALRRLNQLTTPFLLRRMKTDVLKELPPKIENVYHVNLGEEQRKLYLAAVLDSKEKLRAADPEDRTAVFAVLMRLRQICCDPRLVADNWTGGSAKLDACAELVSSAVEGGHRVLLFSQFTSMLALLEQKLDELGISHFTLQGSTSKPQRAELVRRFNAGGAQVFLISLRAGGTGLNLTAADVVIHYDPWWNVAAQNQATDRAYRIGQQNTVQVYKLIAQDTIEKKILELQEAKQDLAQTVTGTADGAIMSMKPEELLELLGG